MASNRKRPASDNKNCDLESKNHISNTNIPQDETARLTHNFQPEVRLSTSPSTSHLGLHPVHQPTVLPVFEPPIQDFASVCGFVPSWDPTTSNEPQLSFDPFFGAELHLPPTPGLPTSPQLPPSPKLGVEPKPTAEIKLAAEPILAAEPKLAAEPQIPSFPELPPCPQLITGEQPTEFPMQNDISYFATSMLDDDFKEQEPEQLQEESEFYEQGVPNEGSPLLYPDAPITLHESLVSLLSLTLRFKLSGACLKSILDFISLIIPKDNNFKTSLLFFKKYFSFMQGPKDYKYYCSKCLSECDSEVGCPLSCEGSKLCCLVKLPIIPQLQTLFNREGFYSKLRFSKENNNTGTINDIYDGKLYQEAVARGILGLIDVLTFQWYTDGLALYTSSNISVWPVFLNINELPYAERFKKQNLLVPALWCGPVKPPGNLLLSAMYDELASLQRGVYISVKDHGMKEVKAFVLHGTGDTPARSMMLNLVQFNGKYSCQCCEQEGEPRENCPGVRIFPYKQEEMIPRTSEKMVQYGKIGTEDNPVKGVKGPTLLSSLMPDFLRGLAIDGMHQTYGGVGVKTLKLLTSTKKNCQKWSVSKYTETINLRLLSIKVPAHFPRIPRPLSDLAYWKMSESKAWLLDYSLPVLKNILPPQYLKHHASLVAAIRLLNADDATSESINIARELLKRYVEQFQDLYDVKYLTINYHLLLHLADLVERLGPGWVYTCFELEGLNGEILNLVHGTRWAEHQIAASVQLCLGLPDLISNLPVGAAKQFCEHLQNSWRVSDVDNVEGSIIIGRCSQMQEIPEFLKQHGTFQKVFEFDSIKRKKYLYVSNESKVSTCRDSTIATFTSAEQTSEVGIIHKFYRPYICECIDVCSCESTLLALIEKLKIVDSFPTLIENVVVPGVNQCETTRELLLIPHTNLQGVCVKINYDENLFVSRPTNSREIE